MVVVAAAVVAAAVVAAEVVAAAAGTAAVSIVSKKICVKGVDFTHLTEPYSLPILCFTQATWPGTTRVRSTTLLHSNKYGSDHGPPK